MGAKAGLAVGVVSLLCLFLLCDKALACTNTTVTVPAEADVTPIALDDLNGGGAQPILIGSSPVIVYTIVTPVYSGCDADPSGYYSANLRANAYQSGHDEDGDSIMMDAPTTTIIKGV